MAAAERGSPPFVGLTGGLGAGKSTALEGFGALGAATLSADAVVHELLDSEELRDAVVGQLGEGMLVDGRLDRRLMADHVFADEDRRRWLEGLLWPRVGERIQAWRAEQEAVSAPARAAVVEVPLLFEAGMEGAFDHVVAVVADEDVRARRAGDRGHAAVDERAGAQLSQEQKSERADFVVRNDGTPDELRAQLSEVLATIAG